MPKRSRGIEAALPSSPQPSTSRIKTESETDSTNVLPVETIMDILDPGGGSDYDPDLSGTDSSRIKTESDMNSMNILPVETVMDFLDSDGGSDYNSDLSEMDFPLESSEESDNDSDSSTLQAPTLFTWNHCRPAVENIPFTGKPGLFKLPPSAEPIDYFFLLANDDFFELILRETNAQGSILPTSCTSKFKQVTREDLEVFLGLIYLAGSIQAPSFDHYWKKNDLYFFPVFSNAMARDRFKSIRRALHFAKSPRKGEPKPSDPLYKVRPLIDHFHKTMQEIYYPQKDLSLDEPMLLWRGRLYYRQYIKNKAHKFRLKYYMLCEPNGLVLRNLIYCGSQDPDIGGTGHTDKVVKTLLNDFLGAGHSVFLDNFYSNVPLVTHLLDHKTYSTGTLRKNRKGNPPEVIGKNVKKGEVEARCTPRGVSVMKWCHKRDVVMVSSEYTADFVKAESKSGIEVKKPEMVHRYNTSICGVDRTDQLFAYYPCEKKTIRWYVKVAMHMFHTIMNNSYLLHKKYSGTNMSLLQFRDAVIQKLIYRNKPRIDLSLKSKEEGIHVPAMSERGKEKKQRKRCRICFAKGLRKEGYFYCPKCPDKPGLCLDKCFAEYHNYL